MHNVVVGGISGHVLKVGSNGLVSVITNIRPEKMRWDVRKSVRDNLALMYKGQELVDLVFKGNKRIPNSSIKFDENGMFHFIVNEVPISESNTLKEICVYLEHIMG